MKKSHKFHCEARIIVKRGLPVVEYFQNSRLLTANAELLTKASRSALQVLNFLVQYLGGTILGFC